jgi:hypothetical protein
VLELLLLARLFWLCPAAAELRPRKSKSASAPADALRPRRSAENPDFEAEVSEPMDRPSRSLDNEMTGFDSFAEVSTPRSLKVGVPVLKQNIEKTYS